VHQGFQRYFQSVWWRVEQLLRDVPAGRPLLICGHSLGAALATLAFRALPDRATSLYTFGCPRVGDRALCAAVESLAAGRACYRTVDHEDVVTHIPLHTAGADYEHPNVTLLWIDAAGAVVRNPPNPPGDWTGIAHLALGF